MAKLQPVPKSRDPHPPPRLTRKPGHGSPLFTIIMQTVLFAASRNVPLVATAVAPMAAVAARRAFSVSARRWQAAPQEKPVLLKEFKIYRWVRTKVSVRNMN